MSNKEVALYITLCRRQIRRLNAAVSALSACADWDRIPETDGAYRMCRSAIEHYEFMITSRIEETHAAKEDKS